MATKTPDSDYGPALHYCLRVALERKGVPALRALELLRDDDSMLLTDAVADVLADTYKATQHPNFPLKCIRPYGGKNTIQVYLIPVEGTIEQILAQLARIGMVPATKACGEALVMHYPNLLSQYSFACLGTIEVFDGRHEKFPYFVDDVGETAVWQWCVPAHRYSIHVAALRVKAEVELALDKK